MSNIAGKSQNCLQLLLQTQFVHTIDAASLALIMPIVERSLDLRSTETKRLACQLLAEMYTFTDPKDLEPYIPSIMPGLKTALVDPVPEVYTCLLVVMIVYSCMFMLPFSLLFVLLC